MFVHCCALPVTHYCALLCIFNLFNHFAAKILPSHSHFFLYNFKQVSSLKTMVMKKPILFFTCSSLWREISLIQEPAQAFI